jgi:hypothetical protein
MRQVRTNNGPGRTVRYECLDEDMRSMLDPVVYAEQQMCERVREIDRRYMTRGNRQHPSAGD